MANFFGFISVLRIGFRVFLFSVANFLRFISVLRIGFRVWGFDGGKFLGFIHVFFLGFRVSDTSRVLGLEALRALGRPPLYLMGCQEINLCVFCCCRYLVFYCVVSFR